MNCLAGELEWTEYRNMWGVLAPDEETARRMVIEMQGRAMDRTAEIEGIEESEVSYTDIPGIVWQGLRQGPMGEVGDDDEDEDDEDEDLDEDGEDAEFDEPDEFEDRD